MIKSCVVCGKFFKPKTSEITCSLDCWKVRNAVTTKIAHANYYKNNTEKIRAYRKRAYEKNREKTYARNRRWLDQNPDKRIQYNAKNRERARRKALLARAAESLLKNQEYHYAE